MLAWLLAKFQVRFKMVVRFSLNKEALRHLHKNNIEIQNIRAMIQIKLDRTTSKHFSAASIRMMK